MKYAIYGAGSLGLVFSAFLKKANEDFDIIDRNIKSVNAINTNGVKVIGNCNMTQNVKCILDSEVKDKYDIIFLFTKAIDNINTIKKVSTFLNDNGVICTMQNGLPESDVKAVLGETRTYGCAVGWGATRIDYGVSELTSANEKSHLTFSFGTLNSSKNEYYHEIKRILSIMGTVEEDSNFIGARYAKLLINASFSGMSTVCGDTFGNVSKNKKSRRVIQRVIKECIDLAKCANIKIEKIQGKDVSKLIDYKTSFKKFISFMIIPIAIKKHKDLKASMLQDVEKSIPCEIDTINGAVCQIGKENNFLTPFNDMIVKIIKDIEAKKLTPSYDNVKLFDKLF